MIIYVILFITGLFGLFLVFKTTDVFVKSILLGQVVAIGLTVVKNQPVSNLGIILFILSLLLVMVYGVVKPGFKSFKRLIIFIPTLIVFLAHLFKMMHLAGAAWLQLGMGISIIAYFIFVIPRIRDYKNEFGFLTIIAVIAAINLGVHFNMF